MSNNDSRGPNGNFTVLPSHDSAALESVLTNQDELNDLVQSMVRNELSWIRIEKMLCISEPSKRPRLDSVTKSFDLTVTKLYEKNQRLQHDLRFTESLVLTKLNEILSRFDSKFVSLGTDIETFIRKSADTLLREVKNLDAWSPLVEAARKVSEALNSETSSGAEANQHIDNLHCIVENVIDNPMILSGVPDSAGIQLKGYFSYFCFERQLRFQFIFYLNIFLDQILTALAQMKQDILEQGSLGSQELRSALTCIISKTNKLAERIEAMQIQLQNNHSEVLIHVDRILNKLDNKFNALDSHMSGLLQSMSTGVAAKLENSSVFASLAKLTADISTQLQNSFSIEDGAKVIDDLRESMEIAIQDAVVAASEEEERSKHWKGRFIYITDFIFLIYCNCNCIMKRFDVDLLIGEFEAIYLEIKNRGMNTRLLKKHWTLLMDILNLCI